jgi:hypothetical protein
VKRTLTLCLWLALAAGCSGSADGEAEVAVTLLAPPVAAAAIRDSEAFREPLLLEIWADGPTAKNLEACGYLRAGDREGHFELTGKAGEIGAREDFFQDDIPVYYFPVGRRELVEIREITDMPAAAGSKRVIFSYRKAPNPLGEELLEAGSRLRQVDPDHLREGRAVLIPRDDGWRMAVLEL